MMVGSDDAVLVISLSETQVKLWIILKEKDKRECDNGFQVFAIQIGGAYLLCCWYGRGTVKWSNKRLLFEVPRLKALQMTWN